MKTKQQMVDIEERLEAGRKAIANGEGIVADSTYFDKLSARAEARLS